MTANTQRRHTAISRRKFLAMAGLGTGLGLAACVQNASVIPQTAPTQCPAWI